MTALVLSAFVKVLFSFPCFDWSGFSWSLPGLFLRSCGSVYGSCCLVACRLAGRGFLEPTWTVLTLMWCLFEATWALVLYTFAWVLGTFVTFYLHGPSWCAPVPCLIWFGAFRKPRGRWSCLRLFASCSLVSFSDLLSFSVSVSLSIDICSAPLSSLPMSTVQSLWLAEPALLEEWSV